MNKPKIFIDGQAGTTGLEIYTRLSKREDIELLIIPEEKRKDNETRSHLMDQADLVFLCLPDAAAKEAVTLVSNPDTKIIDASTAHRTSPGWVYGLPELSQARKQAIRTGKRVANPGCHATGFITVVYPLVQAGILSVKEAIHCFSLTGYSGGGKRMIADYQQSDRPFAYSAPGIYGLTMQHKHIKEMQAVCHLEKAPLFSPIVDDYYRGMATSIQLEADVDQIRQIYRDFYTSGLITVADSWQGNVYANMWADRDSLEIVVNGNENQTIVTALFDNLGKGACGAAIQNMNIMLGFDEKEGLIV